MDDLGIIWYILAAIVYIISKSRKKKATPAPRPGTENNPEPQNKPLTFEDLLREITDDREYEEEVQYEPQPEQKREIHHFEEKEPKKDAQIKTGQRAFADEESRRIYEESIQQAESNIQTKSDESERFLKEEEKEEVYTFADEIRDGLSSDEARKAIIYSEIFNRKY